MFRVVGTKYRKEWGDTSYGTSLRIVLGEAFPEAVPQIEEGSDSLALSTDGRVIFVRREMKLSGSAIAIAYEGGSFGNSKRKNKVRIEKPQMAGRGCAGNYLCSTSSSSRAIREH